MAQPVNGPAMVPRASGQASGSVSHGKVHTFSKSKWEKVAHPEYGRMETDVHVRMHLVMCTVGKSM